eukprot:SAG11_NODE_196_length_12778_cov_6.887767_12_plen_173_part_00
METLKVARDTFLKVPGDQRHGGSTLDTTTRTTGDQDIWRRARGDIDSEHTRASEATTNETGIKLARSTTTTRSFALSLRQRHRQLRDGHSRLGSHSRGATTRLRFGLHYRMGRRLQRAHLHPTRTLVANMRHGEEPDCGGGRDNDCGQATRASTTAICGGVYHDALRPDHLN